MENKIIETQVELELTGEQIERLDEMYGAVHEAICILAEKDSEELPYDISIIGDITDAIINALAKDHNIHVRYPGIVTNEDGSQFYEEYPTKTGLTKSLDPSENVLFYVEFDNGDSNCYQGTRIPTLEEANVFCKEHIDSVEDWNHVVYVGAIDRVSAEGSWDMPATLADASWPVFDPTIKNYESELVATSDSSLPANGVALTLLKEVLGTIEAHDFSISSYEEEGVVCGINLETWTSGGVNMIPMLDFRGGGVVFDPYDIRVELDSMYAEFDVDEAIDDHRQAEDYRSAFSHKQSISDFEEYKERLRELLAAVNDVLDRYSDHGDDVLFNEDDFTNLGVSFDEILKDLPDMTATATGDDSESTEPELTEKTLYIATTCFEQKTCILGMRNTFDEAFKLICSDVKKIMGYHGDELDSIIRVCDDNGDEGGYDYDLFLNSDGNGYVEKYGNSYNWNILVETIQIDSNGNIVTADMSEQQKS